MIRDEIMEASVMWAEDQGLDWAFGVRQDWRTNTLTLIVASLETRPPHPTLLAGLVHHLEQGLDHMGRLTVELTSLRDATSPDSTPTQLVLASLVFPAEVRANPITPIYAMRDPAWFASLPEAP